MRTVHVIYHANCADGFTAAWIARKELIELGHAVDLYACNYKEPFPDIFEHEPIYILDFSFPRNIIVEKQKTNRIIVLDHHKTAEEDLRDLPGVVFDMKRSGAKITWDYFHHEATPVPRLVQYVQDRDLWHFNLPNSQAVSAYIRSWPMTFHVWDFLYDTLENNFGEVIQQGNACLRLIEQQIRTMSKNVYFEALGGYPNIPIVNTCLHFSEVATRLLDTYPDAPFAGCYFTRADGATQWSLRSRSDFDVSKIAQMYGGGGHAQAAGFEI